LYTTAIVAITIYIQYLITKRFFGNTKRSQ
jgi:hypothetical protein